MSAEAQFMVVWSSVIAGWAMWVGTFCLVDWIHTNWFGVPPHDRINDWPERWLPALAWIATICLGLYIIWRFG